MRLISELKARIDRTPLGPVARAIRKAYCDHRELVTWRSSGRPSPPPHIVKQEVLKAHRRAFETEVLVETGTFHGDMIWALRREFSHLVSIELSPALFQRARTRFANEPQVEIVHGNSAEEIGKLIGTLGRPALFWLDGHYSGGETARGDEDTPVMKELAHILASRIPHIIVIDDARCFGTDPAYPSLSELETFIRGQRPNVEITVATDSIRITPQGRPSPWLG